MKTKPISQREARRLRKRVDELEVHIQQLRSSYAPTVPNGIHLGDVSWTADDRVPTAVHTARRLGHAVVAVGSDHRSFRLYAVAHGDLP